MLEKFKSLCVSVKSLKTVRIKQTQSSDHKKVLSDCGLVFVVSSLERGEQDNAIIMQKIYQKKLLKMKWHY